MTTFLGSALYAGLRFRGRSQFPQAAESCTGAGVLARDGRDAYASFMARADCPTCAGSGWKVVERTTAGAQALAADKPGASAGEPKMVWAIPCDCTANDRAERVLSRARVP